MKTSITKLTVVIVAIVAVTACIRHFKSDSSTVEIARSIKPAIHNTTISEMIPLDINLPKPMLFTEPFSMRPVQNLQEDYRYDKPREPLLVPVGTKNIALGKPVFSSDNEPIIGRIEMVTDGRKEGVEGNYVELHPGLQSVTIDLLETYKIYAIVIWHNTRYAGPVYFDVVVQVADDPDFITNLRTLFNNDIDNSAGFGIGKDKHYRETWHGKLIEPGGSRARYVRLYSNGSNANEYYLNHYVEVEVYGKPAK
ncbi:MAG: hypothetical protein FVQ84_21105 [Planctomycetes bacterium]|nr:hypothetical protein [Planctomycetota bacterium]